jgi:hypothetical protein
VRECPDRGAAQAYRLVVSGEVMMSGWFPRTRRKILFVTCGTMTMSCRILPIMNISGLSPKKKRTIKKIQHQGKRPVGTDAGLYLSHGVMARGLIRSSITAYFCKRIDLLRTWSQKFANRQKRFFLRSLWSGEGDDVDSRNLWGRN